MEGRQQVVEEGPVANGKGMCSITDTNLTIVNGSLDERLGGGNELQVRLWLGRVSWWANQWGRCLGCCKNCLKAVSEAF